MAMFAEIVAHKSSACKFRSSSLTQRECFVTNSPPPSLTLRLFVSFGGNGMSKDHLATYLNDHAAGAVAAIDMLEHLEANHRDTELAKFAAALRKDVEADNQELEA